MGGRRDEARAARAAGFTLVELLVVAAVLTIVLLLVVESAQYVRGQGLTRFTLDLLAQVQIAVSQYRENHRGQYPPDRFHRGWIEPTAEGGQGGHQPQTEGIECLVRVLSAEGQKFWLTPPYDRAWANTDQDSNRVDAQPLYELVDGWGRPLLYYNGYGADAARGQGGQPLPDFVGAGKSQMQKLNASLRDRWLHNDRRPLVDSAGADGIYGNSDDPQRIAPISDTRLEEPL